MVSRIIQSLSHLFAYFPFSCPSPAPSSPSALRSPSAPEPSRRRSRDAAPRVTYEAAAAARGGQRASLAFVAVEAVAVSLRRLAENELTVARGACRPLLIGDLRSADNTSGTVHARGRGDVGSEREEKNCYVRNYPQ